MNERIERIRETVRELEKELRELDSLDPAAREMLQDAAHEINAVLLGRTPVAPSPRSLNERLQDAARDFETSHPTLAGVLERIVDGLGQLGI